MNGSWKKAASIYITIVYIITGTWPSSFLRNLIFRLSVLLAIEIWVILSTWAHYVTFAMSQISYIFYCNLIIVLIFPLPISSLLQNQGCCFFLSVSLTIEIWVILLTWKLCVTIVVSRIIHTQYFCNVIVVLFPLPIPVLFFGTW